MPWTNTAILSLIELLIYAIFIPLVVYTAFKHGLRGLLGHIFFAAYIILRVVADGLLIANRNTPTGTTTTTAIVNSIGLSPLLLAVSGFLNETALYTFSGAKEQSERKRLVIVFEVFTHITTVTGIALLAVGSSHVARAESQLQVDHDRTLAEVGAILLLTVWVALCGWAYLTFRQGQRFGFRDSARRLLLGVVVALPFLGARILYTVVYTFDHSANLSPTAAPFAIKLVLVFFMQLFAAMALLAGLLMTTDLCRHAKKSDSVDYRTENHEFKRKGPLSHAAGQASI